MKLYSEDCQAALERGDVLVSAAVEILCDPPFRVFGGYGTITIDGEDYTGIGDRGLAQEVGQSVGGTSQAIQLTLSGVDPDVAALAGGSEIQGAPATIRKLLFDGRGLTLLDASIYARGKVDQLPLDEIMGGTSTLTAMMETAARGLGRKGGRMRTDADQRLVKADDGSFRAVSYAGEKTLYWGGKPPSTAGAALGGSASAGFTANRNVRLF